MNYTRTGRRLFIKRGFKSVVFFSGIGRMASALAVGKGELSLSALGQFRSFLDTLIPQDTSPSACQLQVDIALLKKAKTIQNYPQLIDLGCQWLLAQSTASFGRPFDSLQLTQKYLVVEAAERSARNSIQRMFFERVLMDAFSFYYANPKSWHGLKFVKPPQPSGYLDYDLMPSK